MHNKCEQKKKKQTNFDFPYKLKRNAICHQTEYEIKLYCIINLFVYPQYRVIILRKEKRYNIRI